MKACRGSKLDHGVEVVADGDDETDAPVRRIPAEADFLMAYSTVPGKHFMQYGVKAIAPFNDVISLLYYPFKWLFHCHRQQVFFF